MQKFLFISILLISLSFIKCNTSGSCETKQTCDSCIGEYGCTWCKEKSFVKHQRCNTIAGHGTNRCPPGHIVKAESSSPRITQRKPISKNIRIIPQEVFIDQLAVKQEATIDLTYQDTTDKPLDLYYIMDLSWTMNDDKKTVSRQAENLVTELKRITKDVQLGFGSFIDKPVLPFVAASHLREDKELAIPYGFKNWLKLTENTKQFSNVVANAKISRNLDLPEGTLDALMQAITCINEIGWRNTSRKLIVVATDGPFHIAGDGKLGGIVRPNDMQCHMENNMYTHSTLLDYPSIGEINAAILQHKVYVIFAVSTQGTNSEVFKLYEDLQGHVSQSTAEELTSDSSNVVEKIKAKYLEIKGRVELSVKKPDYVDVKILAKCSSTSGYIKQMHCADVGVGSEIKFQIKITLTKCPSESQQNNGRDKIEISFFELKEKLVINLSYFCKCTNCNEEIHRDPQDLEQYCSGSHASKYISCGTCICKDGRYGSSCQCSINGNDQGNRTNCLNPIENSNIECSSRGECKCGQCECPLDYNGKYCQDSTSTCQDRRPDSPPDRLCSGFGKCDKGKCQCYEGRRGKFCECEKSKDVLCYEPKQNLNSLICNGHGTCDCQQSKCKCDSSYSGQYCEICKVNCPTDGKKLGSRCKDEFLQKCIRCKVQNPPNADKKSDQSQQSIDKCNDLCDSKEYLKKAPISSSGSLTRAEVTSLEILERNSRASLSEEDGTECNLKVNDMPCYTVFKYAYQRSSQRESDVLRVFFTADGVTCEKEPPFIWYILGVILSVLLLGIFGLLIWKLATHVHDTREFQRFEKETKAARWGTGDNPLYEKPMSEFQNPTYRE